MSLIIKKDGIYRKDWVYNEKTEEGKYVETLEENPFSVWSDSVESLEYGFTLRDLLKIFSRNDYMERLEELVDCNIQLFVNEIDETPVSKEPDNDPVHSLEIYGTAELSSYDHSPYDLEKYYGIHGLGNSESNYSMSYSHWSTFVDLPILFNWSIDLWTTEFNKTKKLFSRKIKRQLKHKKLCVMNCVPRFGELMRDVFVDLCFCGSPKNRDGLMEVLNDRVESVNNGTASTVKVDLDELFDKLEEKGE